MLQDRTSISISGAYTNRRWIDSLRRICVILLALGVMGCACVPAVRAEERMRLVSGRLF
jgi:hypothetical protein